MLFFLVSTVIDVDTGLGLTLPEYQPDQTNVAKISPERMAAVLVNENGDVLVDGKPTSLYQIKDNLKSRIASKIDLPDNKKLIISLKTDRRTKYNDYMQALDQIKLAYFEVRDEYSTSQYGRKFKDLPESQQDDVKNKIPIIISIAEPEAIKKG